MRPHGLIPVLLFVLLCGATGTSCLNASREFTCKIKFKRKYDCSLKKISSVENELVIGDQTILIGCGKRVTYTGTKEILVEDN